ASLRTPAEESAATISRASPFRRQTRAMDEPISPMPMSATRLNKGSGSGAPRPSGTRGTFDDCEIFEACYDKRVGLLESDRKPQALRQPIGGNGAQDQSSLRKKLICRHRLRLIAKMQQEKIARAWRDLDPERVNFLFEPGEPSRVMGNRLCQMRL